MASPYPIDDHFKAPPAWLSLSHVGKTNPNFFPFTYLVDGSLIVVANLMDVFQLQKLILEDDNSLANTVEHERHSNLDGSDL